MLNVIRKGGQKDTVPIARWVLPYIRRYLVVRNDRYPGAEDEISLFVSLQNGKAKRLTSDAIE